MERVPVKRVPAASSRRRPGVGRRGFWRTARAVGAVSAVALALINVSPKLISAIGDRGSAAAAKPSDESSAAPVATATRSLAGTAVADGNSGPVNQGSGIQNNGSGPIILGDSRNDYSFGGGRQDDKRHGGEGTVGESHATTRANGEQNSPLSRKAANGERVAAPVCQSPPVIVTGPTAPPSRSFTVNVRVSCAPRDGYTYLLTSRLDDVGQYRTTNIYPVRLSDGSYSVDLTVPTAVPHVYLVYAVPASAVAEITAKMQAGQYWYDQQPVPASFRPASKPVSVKPQQ
jgi:hypothetical protein